MTKKRKTWKKSSLLKNNAQQVLLRVIIENIPDQIYFKDTRSRFVLCNPAVTVNAGTKNVEELIGKTDFDFFPIDDAKKYFDDEQALMKTGKPLINHEEQIVNKITGEKRWNLTTKIPFKDQDGNLFGLIGINRDITDLKLAEKALEESEARLRELNIAKDKFFSIIAHDLKSPFNAITGFSQLLVDQVHERNYEQIEQYAEIILKSSLQTKELLMNLLDWARSQTGKMDFCPEQVNIVELINDVLDLAEFAAHHKNITISKDLPLEVTCNVDKDMVSTVVRNLVSNAIKFTNANGHITISAHQGQNELTVSVCDNGVGIKKENLNKLFRIDANNSTEGTHNEKGTGLGLLLCKEFIEKHGGKIWVESNVEGNDKNQGSTFSFSLPN